MKTIIICLIMGFCSACSHIPPLFGYGTDTFTIHVHPDDMERYKVDRQSCYYVAALTNGGEAGKAQCLKNIGYQVTVDHSD